MMFSQKELFDLFYARASWKKQFAWLPVRCDISKQIVWLTSAYKASVSWRGPGTPVNEVRWVSIENFMVYKLKGLI